MSAPEAERPTRMPWLRRAWVAVAVIPLVFVLSSAVGFSLYKATNSPRENIDASLWMDLFSGVLSAAIFLVPCAAAAIYGKRAISDDDRRGLVPAVIGALAGLGYTVVALVALIAA